MLMVDKLYLINFHFHFFTFHQFMFNPLRIFSDGGLNSQSLPLCMKRPMQPMNMPEPIKLVTNGALMFYSQAAMPPANPMVIQFSLPTIICIGISTKPMYRPNLEKCSEFLLRNLQYP